MALYKAHVLLLLFYPATWFMFSLIKLNTERNQDKIFSTGQMKQKLKSQLGYDTLKEIGGTMICFHFILAMLWAVGVASTSQSNP